MCLDLLTTKRTLKKDKKVWKAVVIKDGREYPAMQFIENQEFMRNTSFPPLQQLKRKNIAKKKTITIAEWLYKEKYKTGFHCCVTERDANFFIWMPGSCVLAYIIPAGTEVQYGLQDDIKVVVTPVLINPRKIKIDNN